MMKQSEIIRIKQYVYAIALSIGLLAPLAAGAETKTIPITITNNQPTCNLTFDNGANSMNYPLGTMTKGTKMQHKTFTVNVDCAGNTTVKTALTARNNTGTRQSGDDTVMMQVNGMNVTGGPLFWLENGSDRVKLTGNDSDSFCTSTSTTFPRKCQLRPVTDIPASSPEGSIDVTMVFNVVYPQ